MSTHSIPEIPHERISVPNSCEFGYVPRLREFSGIAEVAETSVSPDARDFQPKYRNSTTFSRGEFVTQYNMVTYPHFSVGLVLRETLSLSTSVRKVLLYWVSFTSQMSVFSSHNEKVDRKVNMKGNYPSSFTMIFKEYAR